VVVHSPKDIVQLAVHKEEVEAATAKSVTRQWISLIGQSLSIESHDSPRIFGDGGAASISHLTSSH
jgi:hypothetical protein